MTTHFRLPLCDKCAALANNSRGGSAVHPSSRFSKLVQRQIGTMFACLDCHARWLHFPESADTIHWVLAARALIRGPR